MDAARGWSSALFCGNAASGVPVAAYLLLPAAVFAVSSAATVFELMSEVPPITLASWRLQLTTVILAIGAAWQWRGLDTDTKAYCRSKAPFFLASGLCLALHFGCWVWSLEHTSLTHSLLFVSCSPLLLAALALLRREPISRTEILGAVIGMLGALILVSMAASSPADEVTAPPARRVLVSGAEPAWQPAGLASNHGTSQATLARQLMQNEGAPDAMGCHCTCAGAKDGCSSCCAAVILVGLAVTVVAVACCGDGGKYIPNSRPVVAEASLARQPQLAGDLASLVAAIAFVGYIQIGSSLRQRTPIFIYACPVTGVAALSLAMLAALTDGAAAVEAGLDASTFVFGYLFNRRYAALVAYLAVVPGIIGHTGFNTLLRYMTSLTVALAFQLEPPVGSLIGWWAGVEAAPGWGTLLGGLVMLGATVMVTWASTQRQEQLRQGAAVEKVQGVQLGRQGDVEGDGEEGEKVALLAAAPAASSVHERR